MSKCISIIVAVFISFSEGIQAPIYLDEANSTEAFSQSKLFNYLSVEENRQKILKNALELNNGQYVNACVYFVPDALRQNGVDIPSSTCNTTGLIS